MLPFSAGRPESIHYRLHEFAKSALVKIFAHPYATVCDLYCGAGLDAEIWAGTQIGHYVGIDVPDSGLSEIKEALESHKKAFSAEFFEADPCSESFEAQLKEKAGQADLVCCLQNLQLCFETEESARRLLHSVSSLLKPGGYFFGITPDSSTIWAKYQKNVEAYHNRSASMKPNIVPNCIRSENYMITFEVEEEKFPLFGKKYQLKFAHDNAAETYCLVHFPSLIRMHFAGMVMNAGSTLVDPRGRLLPKSYDVLGLYSTFIFQKPDLDAGPPLATPQVVIERDWQATATIWKDDEKAASIPVPAPAVLPAIVLVLRIYASQRLFDVPHRRPKGSPRDYVDHDTHIASIAAGSHVPNATYYGLAAGTASGGSPSARIAVYKACSEDGCSDSTILKAMNDAIEDGVDFISISIGSSSTFQPGFLQDPIAIGAFHAMEKGVTVICAAGNEGPDLNTVVNTAPSIFTAAASNIDCDFQSTLVLGNGKTFKGSAINFSNLSLSRTYALVYGAEAATNFTPMSESRFEII
ncbi:mRNA cap guanine-N7 methyltransferase 2 [Linum perenne]